MLTLRILAILCPLVLSSSLILSSSLGESQSWCILAALPYENDCNSTDLEGVTVVSLNESLKLLLLESKLQYSTLLHFVSKWSLNPPHTHASSEVTCHEITGVIGGLNSNTARIISTLARDSNFNIALISAITSSIPNTNHNLLNNFLDMNPLKHYIEALVNLIDQKNWTRIGLINGPTPYHQYVAELLQRDLLNDLGINVVPYIRLTGESFSQPLKVIREYETQIIILSMKGKAVCSLLKEAGKLDFNWPNYAWIILNSESSISNDSEAIFNCSHEGAFVVQDYYVNRKRTMINNKSHSEVEQLIERLQNTTSLFHSDILLDSLIIALANKTSNVLNASISFTGASGIVRFRNGDRLSNISISQKVEGSMLEIANYDGDLEQLTWVCSSSETSIGPRGTTLTIYNESAVLDNVLIATIVFLCFAITTVIFILYIFFRYEKEIKATSVTVSLSMFLGCYLLLLFVPLLLVKSHWESNVAVPHAVTCNFLAWLGGTGIPLALILATIFVKILRVYAVFQHPFSIKKKLLTDCFLLIYSYMYSNIP